MIKINSEFSIHSDGNCWQVLRKRNGINKKTKEPCVSEKRTYHATLRQACNAVVEQSVEKCVKVRKILETMDELQADLLELAEKITAEK